MTKNHLSNTCSRSVASDQLLSCAILENVPVGILVCDPHTMRIVMASAAMCRLCGFERKELVGQSIELIHPASDWPQIRAEFERIASGKSTYADQIAILRKDKAIFPTEVHASIIALEQGPGVLGVFTDISERVLSMKQRERAEKALRQSEQRFMDIMHASDEPIVLVGPNQFHDCNEAAAKAMGYPTREAFLQADRAQTAPPTQPDGQDSVEKARYYEELVLKRGFVRFEWVHRHADGHDFPADVSLTHIIHQGVSMIYCVWRDLTAAHKLQEERELLQTQLLQAQKMESVGRLAGGVAHDFNNMLSVILGNAELAMSTLSDQDSAYRDLDEIRCAAQRSAELTRQLLAFARKQNVTRQAFDLNTVVQGMLKMLMRLIGEGIDLLWLPSPSVCPVFMDPSQIDQILANLCVNARDAIGDSGKITIETNLVEFDQSFCDQHPGFAPGDYVSLSVSDNGCGMDAATISQLFEPFFTTKEVGKGTGLGLSTVYGIVKQNNGFIKIYSEPGHGSAFKIHLPRHLNEHALIANQSEPSIESSTAGSETILLVEDEVAILDLTRKLLERLGYNVIASALPGEAIQRAREYSGRIDLLFADVIMPEMNGQQLATELRALQPQIRCLFMSGYTSNVVAHHGIMKSGVHFIQKPFTTYAIAKAIRKALSDG